MRSLFDQYTAPENRLTHALLSCLDKDRRLLRAFILWMADRRVSGRSMHVVAQGFPGDTGELSEDEAERRGIPDGCVADGTGWALLLESKFAAAVQVDQLVRHLRTARRHGIDRPMLLLLTVGRYSGRTPRAVRVVQWLEVYAWLQRQLRKSQWARWCAEYFEVAEAKEAQNGYLTEGTLTVFTGIPFGSEPYNYMQAKRLLGLLRTELLRDRRLEAKLGVDRQGEGRGAIKGRGSDRVWDYLSLKGARGADTFTQFPHLTFSIHADKVESYVTIPNSIRADMRSGILGDSYESFAGLMLRVTENLRSVAKMGAHPMIVLVQRHYPAQSSPPVEDATVKLDPRTAFASRRIRGDSIKYQPQWLRGVYEVLVNRRANVQLQVGADFKYAASDVCAGPEIADAIGDVWVACRPLIQAAIGSRGG